MSIDLSKCSHVLNAYGDIMYYFFGAFAASPNDLFQCSQLFNG